jgi:hypothetical protein
MIGARGDLKVEGQAASSGFLAFPEDLGPSVSLIDHKLNGLDDCRSSCLLSSFLFSFLAASNLATSSFKWVH